MLFYKSYKNIAISKIEIKTKDHSLQTDRIELESPLKGENPTKVLRFTLTTEK
jgi:hypothetical protein